MTKNDTVEIFISKQDNKNINFLQGYLEGYHNEKNPFAYQKSFAEYIRPLLVTDETSYKDSYLGDRLAELGALSIASGACAIDGTVKSIVDATSVCTILGMVMPNTKLTSDILDMVAPNTKLTSDIGKGVFNEAYSGIIDAYEEMQQYNSVENKGKRPEDIYRESVQKIKDSLDRITPSEDKLRSAIICGVVCGGLGVSTGILFDGGLSATLASLIGGGALGTYGTVNGYLYHREITKCYEEVEKWTVDLFTGKLFEAEIEKEKSEEHKFQEIIEENLLKIKKAEYMLHGIEEKSHAIKGFKKEITIQGERDYDPTEEMYRSRFNSYKSTNSDKSFTNQLQKQRRDNKSKDHLLK